MVDDKKNDGSSDEFDDIDFEDFADNFDEAQLQEEEALSDLPEEDFSDENFGDDDWEDSSFDDDAEAGADPSLITQGKGKGDGLSFNTIVMIGAFIVGAGVLAINIMVKSGSQSGVGGTFQSMLNIGGVMDGDFFGDKKKEEAAQEAAARQQEALGEGFLNNPESLDPNANPPQPTPIAPPEEVAGDNQPLTPMPDTAPPAVTPGETPRGPDEGVPESNVAVAELPAEAQTPPASQIEETPVETTSAEDILKKAMESREQKAASAEPAPPVEEAAGQEPKQSVETPDADEPELPSVADAPVSAPVEEPPAKMPESAEPSVPPEIIAENTKALEAVDGRLEELFKRIEQVESDIGSVKNSEQADTQDLEQMVESLKAEIAELKKRPVPAAAEPVSSKKPAAAEEPEADEASDEVVEEEAPKPAVKKAAKPKPVKTAAKKPAVATGRWELRAAQPGRAWVSRPGERDMQSVEVGQSLTGIGRVTAILYQNRRWTVQGTSGQINQ
ncbi:MAG TPA: hypothetical protein VFS88_08705 [Micavibrio sp.]|nr:hypothetical protein [Micavibrio sp.]